MIQNYEMMGRRCIVLSKYDREFKVNAMCIYHKVLYD